MFTGIVEEVGRVRNLSRNRLVIAASRVLEGTSPGDSICVNGACLTVVEVGRDFFVVELMEETLRRTNLGQLKVGQGVNLERPLVYGGRVGGHLVQGHVDDTGRIVSLAREGAGVRMAISFPARLAPYMVPKGFIAVDGVSLTLVDVLSNKFTVSLVAYTLSHTNLGEKKVGDRVNLEVDIVAKYIEKLLRRVPSISEEFLAKTGFLEG